MGGPKHDITKSNFGFRDVFGISARIYAEHLGKIALIGIGIYLPVKGFVAYGVARNDLKTALEIYMVQGIFDLLITCVALLLVIRLTANAVDREATDLASVWKQATSRYLYFVPGLIAWEVVILGLAFLLLIPALAGYVYVFFFMQVIALRQETGFHALKQSKRLVEGNFWRVAGYVVIFELIAMLGLADDLMPGSLEGVLLGTAGAILSLYAVVAATVLYLHLERTRFGYEE